MSEKVESKWNELIELVQMHLDLFELGVTANIPATCALFQIFYEKILASNLTLYKVNYLRIYSDFFTSLKQKIRHWLSWVIQDFSITLQMFLT
jgi:hypothetical protein